MYFKTSVSERAALLPISKGEVVVLSTSLALVCQESCIIPFWHFSCLAWIKQLLFSLSHRDVFNTLSMHVHFEKILMDQCHLKCGEKKLSFKSSLLLPGISSFLPRVLPATSLQGDYICLRNEFGHAVINVLALDSGGGIQTAEGHAQKNPKFPRAGEVGRREWAARGAGPVPAQPPPGAPRSCGRAAARGKRLQTPPEWFSLSRRCWNVSGVCVWLWTFVSSGGKRRGVV